MCYGLPHMVATRRALTCLAPTCFVGAALIALTGCADLSKGEKIRVVKDSAPAAIVQLPSNLVAKGAKAAGGSDKDAVRAARAAAAAKRRQQAGGQPGRKGRQQSGGG